ATRTFDQHLVARLLALLPALDVPDLDAVELTADDDVALEAGEGTQAGRDGDAALTVELAVLGGREEIPHPCTRALLARAPQLGHLLGAGLEVLERPDGDAAVDLLGHHRAALELVAVLGREDDPALIIDGVTVLTEEHDGRLARAVPGAVERRARRAPLPHRLAHRVPHRLLHRLRT